MFIFLILLSLLEKEKKYIFLMFAELFFIIYIIMQVKLNYGADFIRYTLFFYLLYFIALQKQEVKMMKINLIDLILIVLGVYTIYLMLKSMGNYYRFGIVISALVILKE